ncbi:hypothetical protein LI012_09555 [Caldibacillus thermoamylovorans]|uniref:hypothetical protein n=1 Tax=Bacillaceae TaxID=186817 RepID=UPI00137530AB|nr:hypothetical protein [Caldibacillus thermoamylovorans]MCB5936157.1 hypothetical protein [Bacillus sp. DFI.2.34]MCB7077066.1 hypothetical protein [Caldibacillus thermoamylovorans]
MLNFDDEAQSRHKFYADDPSCDKKLDLCIFFPREPLQPNEKANSLEMGVVKKLI